MFGFGDITCSTLMQILLKYHQIFYGKISGLQPRDTHCNRVAFVISLITLPGHNTLLSRCDFHLSCFSGTGQQLLNRGRRQFLPYRFPQFPNGEIGDADDPEQRLRLM